MRSYLRKSSILLILMGIAMLGWGVTSAFAEIARQNAANEATYGKVLEQVAPTIGAFRLSRTPSASGGAPTLAPSASPTRTNPTAARELPPTDEPNDAIMVPVEPTPTTAPTPAEPLIPKRLLIPSIKLDAPIIPSDYQLMLIGNQVFQQWVPPDRYAVGWQSVDTPLGVPGNTVLMGHHNVYGEVFGHLIDLSVGDTFTIVMQNNTTREYRIALKMIVPERNEPISVRLRNAQWLLPTSDERITMVTCWPHESNTHRLIIVSVPVTNP